MMKIDECCLPNMNHKQIITITIQMANNRQNKQKSSRKRGMKNKKGDDTSNIGLRFIKIQMNIVRLPTKMGIKETT